MGDPTAVGGLPRCQPLMDASHDDPRAPAAALCGFLQALGVPESDVSEDSIREIAATFCWLTRGYRQRPEDVVGDARFHVEGGCPVLVRDIPFVSLCRHHLVPFRGVVHVAYLPTGHVVGLSKLARIVDVYAARLQTQTSLTELVGQALTRMLPASGVGVWIDARHDCTGHGEVVRTRAILGELRLPAWDGWIAHCLF